MDADTRIANVAAQAAVKAVMQMGYKAPANTAAATGWVHGVGGFLGVPGIDPEVISARVQPRGLLAALPLQPSVYAFPEFAYITGIEDLSSDEPTTECETCIQAVKEGCIQSACFGRICRETQTMTPARVIERINRGDIDLSLMNDMLGTNEWAPWLAGGSYNLQDVLNNATMQALVEVSASMLNPLVRMVWQGNPANNIGTGYGEFSGLDIFINQNKIDYRTSVRCEALDSDVKDFNYQNINTVAAGNVLIVRMLSALEAYLYFNAERMSLLPVEWVWVMRPEMWRELTEMWPIAYLTTRNITLPAGNTMMLDATRINDMRDLMRRGLTLEVNGRIHRVILDDGIALERNADDPAQIPVGSLASNIYLIPLRFNGSRPGVYLNYLDYRVAQPEIAMAKSQDRFWTDGTGKFLWTVEYAKYCYTLSAEIRPRLVLKVPQLAGRLNNVVCSPEQEFRSPFEDDYEFHKGGAAHRAYPPGIVYPDHATSGTLPTDGSCSS